MQPKFELSKTNVPEDVDTKQVQRDIRKTAGSHCARIHDTINKDKFQSKLKEFLRDLPNQDAEIVTLGTGSSLPSRYRNVSATLLKVPGHGNYLFDCGENTLGQLQRRYTPEELKEILRDLKVIWISHLHADHHLGIVAVIKAWHQEVYGAPSGAPAEPEQDLTKILSEKRLCIVSAKHMIQWLSEYACVENYGFDKIVPIESDTVFNAGQVESIFTYNHFASDRTPLLDHDGNQIRTPLSFDPSASPLAPLLQSLTGLSSILVAPVLHCAGSQGTAFVFPSGFKVAYSGDCRPSGYFTGIGQDATVLIHECTFDDTMKSDAIAKRHSTISEALKVGAAMRARIIVLTHFSQRYGTGPRDGSFRLLWDPEYRSRKVSQAGTKSSRWRSRSPSPTPSQSPSRSNALDGRNANFNPDVPMPDIDFSDDIPISRLPSTTHHPSCVPVVTGYDLMSVRVGDALNAQEYGQAMMRVFCATLGEEEAAAEQIDSPGGNAGETESARKKKKAEKKKEKEKEAAEQKALRVKKAVEKAQEKARRAAEESGKGVEWRVDKMTPAQRRGRREPGFVYESTAGGAERGDGSGEENAAASAAGGR
ncbi:hypothetical protein FQN53_004699 [Emmonsiellopsis sp. PD_33]|nr:hypothetical protein FQN53_004699 [Emmonsiellopsis sp. PD_33]